MRRSGPKNAVIVESLDRRLFLSAAVKAAKPLVADAPTGPRIVENLGRGVTVVRAATAQNLVSWRLLALDPTTIAFNVYRSANGASPVKLNASPITASTNYADTTANNAVNNTYYVRPILGGVEQPASGTFTLTANHAVEPVVRIPLKTPEAGYSTKFVWVGDLDGDGEYDYVIDRLSSTGLSQRIEAYRRDGTFLWDVDLGPNSLNTNNIEPGSSTIDVGNWDGVTVFDMDSDGKAEVLIRSANGVRFGDGTTVSAASNDTQFISVLNGQTGAERARVQWTNNYLADGPMAMMFTIGYLDGVHPSLLVKAKNRVGSGGFNQTMSAFRFDGTSFVKQWQWDRGNSNNADGHNVRAVDLDGDGKDEFTDIGFALNSNGTLRYSLTQASGVVHGDRYYIADIDPARPGLEGYGIQQNNPSKLYDYYYDASTGQMIWQHFSAESLDVGRGLVADIDPSSPGMETFAFDGVWSASANTKLNTAGPWPSFGLHWDADLSSENYNDGKLEEWVPASGGMGRLVTAWKFDGNGSGVNPLMIGDIFGDYREEVVLMNLAGNSLTIFSTDRVANNRFYTFAQNPAYRNGMTAKGYMQSHSLDYYFGAGMATPPRPNVVYAGTQTPTTTVTTAYQTENAVRTNVPIESNYGGYNGTGFGNFPGTGGSATWNNVNGGLGGVTTVRFRYALGAAAARTGVLNVNGVTQPITFQPSGGYNQWTTVTAVVSLNAGTANTIQLQSTGQDAGNVDELQVSANMPLAPQISGFKVNDGSAQRSRVTSLSLTFDRPVSVGGGAVSLWRRTAAGATATQVTGFTLTAAGADVYTLTFPAAAFVGRSLEDGLYELRISAAGVTAAGVGLAADATYAFHRLAADVDGNRTVNFNDFLVFQGAFGATAGMPAFVPALDLDDDDLIAFNDFLVLQSRFGQTL